jgi:hypothetical protein
LYNGPHTATTNATKVIANPPDHVATLATHLLSPSNQSVTTAAATTIDAALAPSTQLGAVSISKTKQARPFPVSILRKSSYSIGKATEPVHHLATPSIVPSMVTPTKRISDFGEQQMPPKAKPKLESPLTTNDPTTV